MIYDVFDHADHYFDKGNALYTALCFARDFDPSLPDGRHEIEGERIYALVSSYETSPAAKRLFEGHRGYIDVQAVLEGEEKIEVSLETNLETLQEYSAEKDVAFFGSPVAHGSLVMRPGTFAVFFPHDIHRPNCNLRGKRRVRKVVVKVLAD